MPTGDRWKLAFASNLFGPPEWRTCKECGRVFATRKKMRLHERMARNRGFHSVSVSEWIGTKEPGHRRLL